MNTKIEIINNSEITISKYSIGILRTIIKDFFRPVTMPYFISIVLFNDGQMRSLNNRYFQKDMETDVISFSFLGNYSDNLFLINYSKTVDIYSVNDNCRKEMFLPVLQIGEAYISVDQALIYQEINNSDIRKELNYLLMHSLLHLIGYEDDTVKKREIMNFKSKYFLVSFYLYNKIYKTKRGNA